jgi:hypothetical protein
LTDSISTSHRFGYFYAIEPSGRLQLSGIVSFILTWLLSSRISGSWPIVWRRNASAYLRKRKDVQESVIGAPSSSHHPGRPRFEWMPCGSAFSSFSATDSKPVGQPLKKIVKTRIDILAISGRELPCSDYAANGAYMIPDFQGADDIRSILERLIPSARELMLEHRLVYGQQEWAITAIELYLWTGNSWCDPCTDRKSGQEQFGKWYVNRGCNPNHGRIDIAAGNGRGPGTMLDIERLVFAEWGAGFNAGASTLARRSRVRWQARIGLWASPHFEQNLTRS